MCLHDLLLVLLVHSIANGSQRSPVLPRTEPRDTTLGPIGYPCTSPDKGIVDRLSPPGRDLANR